MANIIEELVFNPLPPGGTPSKVHWSLMILATGALWPFVGMAWALLFFFVGGNILGFIAGAIYGLTFPHLPISWQRAAYLRWKARVKTAKIHPLVDFPLIVFVETNLDKEFEAGGIIRAQASIAEFLSNLDEKLQRLGNP